VIEIVSATSLATVQDLGRDGYLRYGVGTSGAMDRVALAAGNILVGNPAGAAGIEIPVFPFHVRFLADTVFALTGADASARLGDRALPPWWVTRALKGEELRLAAPKRGARCYLTVAGGLDVPEVLGSRSTQLRGAFGGLDGRPLRRGDIVGAGVPADPIAPPPAGFGVEPPGTALPLVAADTPAATAVRVLPAGEYECYDAAVQASFWRQAWKITPQSDRYGYRLDGAALVPKTVLEQRSHGIVPGVIQVPHSGQPIIQLRDAQPSGGYPKIGTVIEADLWRVGQARPGTTLRFVETTYADAVAALDDVTAYLDRIRRARTLYLLATG
jgi:biotin-dependent carboxylase-like uncharacterized protein